MLGEGGMGQVYRATQINLRREVALKILSSELPDSVAAQRRFLREARVASALQHRNAVEIYDVGVHEGIAYIAMELIRGAVLRDVIEDAGVMSMPDTIEIGIQIADLLLAAHALPLVHRDLKPENIFVEYDREGGTRVRVVDFGLAFIEGDQDSGRLTREGLVVGTPAFLSPEQAQGAHVGPPSDIYSLACVMYEMLSGQLVFSGSQMNILTQHIYVAPVSLRERMTNAGIPSDLDDLILRMLSKNPAERPTAEEVMQELRSVQGTLAGQRHRGRDDRLLQSRNSRMISVPEQPAPRFDGAAIAQASPDAQSIRVGVIGEFDDSLWFGMASNGLHPERVDLDQDPATASHDAILVEIANLDTLTAFANHGIPVVAVSPASRVEVLAELVRRGVSEVVSIPLQADEVARKIRRAVVRSRRHNRRTQ